MTVADRIRQVMGEAGLTIDEFAQQLGEKPQRVKDVLRGKQRAPEAMLVALAKLKVDVVYVLTGETRALRAALGNVSTASAVADRLGKTAKEKAEIQEIVFQSLHEQANSTDESELIDSYRRCNEEGQITLRKLAAQLSSNSKVSTDKRADATKARQTFHGDVGQVVQAEGDIHNKKQVFNVGTRKKK